MRPRLLASAILLAGLAPCAAYAQSSTTNSANPTTGPSASTSTQPSNQTGQAVPQKIQQKLQQQGFTDVKVVPGSFIVTAKDKDGDPVNMVIGPNSMMMMTTSQVSGTPDSTGQSSTSSTK